MTKPESEREPTKPPALDYRTPSVGTERSLRGWFRQINEGEDSFLACSGLLFAVLCWATFVLSCFGRVAGGLFVCVGFVMAALSTVLASAALFERRTSKTFPVLSLLLDGVYASTWAWAAWHR